MKKINLLWLVFLCCISCKGPNQSNQSKLGGMQLAMDMSGIEAMPVDESNAQNITVKEDGKWDTDLLVKDIQYIPLETRDDVLIGQVDKLIFEGGRFYIMDKHQTKSVFVFGEDGRHIHTISAIGRGPQEYSDIDYIEVDSCNNELVITDMRGQSMLFFDLDGKFKERKSIGVRFDDIVKIAKDNYVMYSGSTYNGHIPEIEYSNIIIGNPGGEIKYKGLEQTKFYHELINKIGKGISHIHKFGDKVLFCPPAANSVYEITPSKVILRYNFIFPKGTPSLYESYGAEDFRKKVAENDTWFFLGNRFSETKEHIITSVEHGIGTRMFFFNKLTGEGFTPGSGIVSGTGRTMRMLEPKYSDSDYFYDVKTFYDIKDDQEFAEERGYKNWKLPEILEGIKESDNPVIVRYNLNSPFEKARL